VQATIEVMTGLGSQPMAIAAAIGPHISAVAFEVAEDVAAELARASGGDGAVTQVSGQKPHVDLARIVAAQLTRAGVERESIEQLAGCTYRDERDFFSYRRDGKRSGRMLAAIVPGVATLAPEREPRASHSGTAGATAGLSDP
jgi:hypothetical protein